jgi:hypothetical protein
MVSKVDLGEGRDLGLWEKKCAECHLGKGAFLRGGKG